RNPPPEDLSQTLNCPADEQRVSAPEVPVTVGPTTQWPAPAASTTEPIQQTLDGIPPPSGLSPTDPILGGTTLTQDEASPPSATEPMASVTTPASTSSGLRATQV